MASKGAFPDALIRLASPLLCSRSLIPWRRLIFVPWAACKILLLEFLAPLFPFVIHGMFGYGFDPSGHGLALADPANYYLCFG